MNLILIKWDNSGPCAGDIIDDMALEMRLLDSCDLYLGRVRKL